MAFCIRSEDEGERDVTNESMNERDETANGMPYPKPPRWVTTYEECVPSQSLLHPVTLKTIELQELRQIGSYPINLRSMGPS